MKRLSMIVALGAMLGMFAGVLTASPALAGRGHKWQLVSASGVGIIGAKFCGFKIKAVPTAGKEYQKVLKASDGSMTFLTTGSAKGAFTNLSTGKTVTENVSGPGKLTVFPDGSAVAASTGHSGFLLAPADQQRFGLPGFFVSTGGLRTSFAADGSITSLSLKGHVLANVCAALS